MSPESFEVFYATHASHVRRVIGSLVRQHQEADDVLQDVFLQAWQQMGRFDAARGSIESWLATIARSRAIDRLRVRARFLAADDWDKIASGSADGLTQILRREQDGAVQAAVDRLTDAQRRMIGLAYDEGLSHSGIAARLRRPLGTIKTHLRGALRDLRTEVGSAGSPFARFSATDGQPPFTIPVEGDAGSVQAWPALAADDSLRTRLEGLRVVAIDDDVEALKLVEAVLARFGATTSVHASVASGIAAVELDWPDLVVADLDMPGEDGYDCIARLRALDAGARGRLSVVAFTGCVSEQERSRVTLAGFDAYLTKPLHPLALLSVAARLGRAQAA
ncbi:MAG: sigma-70 family RNA polymerase sigma factor [Acidobacteriota bacterium]|nr:sigma-70 family RNA polymerase sigma factor [Acidobacteriota bacterium]